jgi:hypothetical protein
MLAIALFAVSFGVKAQQWYVMGEYIWSPPHPQGTYEELHVQGEDVEINGMEYHTIYNQTQGILLGAYRNEENQVYYCKWNGNAYNEEVLLYDYDLEEGDYFNEDDPHPMMITDISIIIDNNGVERRKFEFEFMGLDEEREFWIEGVGSSKGFVNSGNYTPTSDGAIFHLLCYHVDNNVVYVNPAYDVCDVDDIDESSINNSISIYPNPTKDIVKVLNNSNLNISKIEIIDLLGRTVASAKSSDEINVSNLPEGQYFVKLHGETTIVKKLTISK